MGDLAACFGWCRETSVCYGNDLRPDWWKKFSVARGFSTSQIPNFFCSPEHPLYELGKEPLLAYLVCRSVLPLTSVDLSDREIADYLNDHTKNENRNVIFQTIVDEVRLSKLWRDEQTQVALLSSQQFFDILRFMALATWQEGSSRKATINRIRGVIPKGPLEGAFERLVTFCTQTGVANLVTAFYYRIHNNSDYLAEHEFEFTHKTFSEYLLVTLLFDKFEQLLELEQVAWQNFGSEEFSKKLVSGLQDWMEATTFGPETNDIAQFVIDEAKLRYKNRDIGDWAAAFGLIQRILAGPQFDSKEAQYLSHISKLRRSAMLVLFLWGAVNRAHYLSTGEQHLLGDGIETFDLKLLQSPLDLGTEDGVSQLETLSPSFLGYCLSGVSIINKDLTGIFSNGGEIVGLHVYSSGLEHSFWNRIYMSNCSLERANFMQSRFTHSRLDNITCVNGDLSRSLFVDLVFDHVVFDDTSLEQCEFRKCQFNHCTFNNSTFNLSDLDGTQFYQCTLKKSSFERALLAGVRFLECEFDDNSFYLADSTDLVFESCLGDYEESRNRSLQLAQTD